MDQLYSKRSAVSSEYFLACAPNPENLLLLWACPGVIILSNGDNYMQTDSSYVSSLEKLIKEKLLPAYSEYCSMKGIVDEINLPVRRIPALLDKNFGVSVATSNVRKPRKN